MSCVQWIRKHAHTRSLDSESEPARARVYSFHSVRARVRHAQSACRSKAQCCPDLRTSHTKRKRSTCGGVDAATMNKKKDTLKQLPSRFRAMQAYKTLLAYPGRRSRRCLGDWLLCLRIHAQACTSACARTSKPARLQARRHTPDWSGPHTSAAGRTRCRGAEVA